MSRVRVSTSFLDVGGDGEAERLDLSQGGQVYALEWLNEGSASAIPQPRVQIVGEATLSAHVMPKSAVDAEADRVLPVGTIIMWHGSESGIPWNWAICDGRSVTTSSGQQITTPDLRDTYLMGQDSTDSLPRGTTRGADGGEDPRSHRVPVPLPRHAHRVQSQLAGSASAYNPNALVRATSSSHTHSHVVAEKVVSDLKFETTFGLDTSGVPGDPPPHYLSGGFLTPKYYDQPWQTHTASGVAITNPSRTSQSRRTDGGMSAYRFDRNHSSWTVCNSNPWTGQEFCGSVAPDKDPPVGLTLRENGVHTHAVDWKHEHNLSDVGVDNPTTDVQPPYIALHHIIKVE
jgi:hypothetical protein